jgi:hypothetical protein
LCGSGWFGEGENAKNTAFQFSEIVQNADKEDKFNRASAKSKERWKNPKFANTIRTKIKNNWKDEKKRKALTARTTCKHALQIKSKKMKKHWQEPEYLQKIENGKKISAYLKSKQFDSIKQNCEKLSGGKIKIDSKNNEWLLENASNGSLKYARLPRFAGAYLALSNKNDEGIILLDETGLAKKDAQLLEIIKIIYGSLESLKSELKKFRISSPGQKS